jgi:hypothetical protein
VVAAVSPSKEKLRLAWVSNGNSVYTDKYEPPIGIRLQYLALR